MKWIFFYLVTHICSGHNPSAGVIIYAGVVILYFTVSAKYLLHNSYNCFQLRLESMVGLATFNAT